MGLFDKKFCDICGQKIGLLGNRKLEDGNLCKNCARQLSPWFSERRHSTVGDIRAQLDYRARNYEMLRSFRETRVVGTNWQVHIDDNQRLFFVTRSRNWMDENPDLIRFDQVLGCQMDIEQHVRREPAEGPGGQGGPSAPGRPGGQGGPGGPSAPGRPGGQGGPGSPNAPGRPGGQGGPGGPSAPGRPGGQGGQGGPPPEIEVFSYDFYVYLNVACDWFDDIRFQVNNFEIEERDRGAYDSAAYETQLICDTINALPR